MPIPEEFKPAFLFKNVKLGADGFWRNTSISRVNYPEGGNEELAALEDNSFWFQHRRNCVLDLTAKFPPGMGIIDLGGGNGFMAAALQNAGYNTLLIEPGLAGVQKARSRGVKTIIHASFGDLSAADGSLASIGLFDVLEHIEADVEFLKNLHRTMPPGSHLYLTVPALQFLWSNTDEYSGHYRRYCLPELRTKLEQAGFNIRFASYFFSLLVPPLLLTRTFPSLFSDQKIFSDRRNKSEHLAGNALARSLALKILSFERWLLKSGRALPIGSSCLAVASRD